MARQQTIAAPNGRGDRIETFSSSASVTISVSIPPAQYGDEPTTDLIEAPAGSQQPFNQQRMCGDWYAEFTAGNRIRSAVADTQADSIRAAAAKFAA